MSNFDDKCVKLISQLCRIDLSEEELATISTDVGRILDYVEQLHEVDVSHLSPTSHIEEQGIGALREDKVGELLPRDEFLADAPDQIGGMIRVPPVIKQQA